MCRVLAYVGPEIPLLTPDNSLVNQALDPERHPELQLAGWGFGAWGDHLLKPDEPLIYRRPMAAFYDDNAASLIPSLQANTMLAHVRAAAYDSQVVLADENCHPFFFEGAPWLVAQNGYLPGWQVLQRELLQHCRDAYLTQMRGTTDTEFLAVLLLSLLEGESDEHVQRAVEQLVRLVADAMSTLQLPGLTKLKMALVSPGRVIGINWGFAPRRGGSGGRLARAAHGTCGHRRLRPRDAPGADVRAARPQLRAGRGDVRLRGAHAGRRHRGDLRFRAPHRGR